MDAARISENTALVRQLPIGRGAEHFRSMPAELALGVFEDLSPRMQADLLGELGTTDLTDLFEDLDPDDRAALLDELPESVAESVLQELSPAERHLTATVREYPQGSVGRRMSPEVLTLRDDWSAGRARDHVLAHIAEPETVYLLPVTDDEEHLVGVLGLRRLLGTDPATAIAEIMQPAVSASAHAPREEVAIRFKQHKLLAMPITGRDDRLVGVLTVDDAVAILDEEQAEDYARTSGSEPLRTPYLATGIRRLVRSRVVWLLVLAISAILTVQVLELFEDKLAQVVVLALFIPLLTGTAGNTGNQAATTVTRALALGDVRSRDALAVLGKEVRVGLLLGALLGLGGFALATLVYGQDIGLVIGLTLVVVCTMAASVGGLMPLVAKAVGADPAVFSNPFISTFCDATGLLLYFGIATAVLGI